MKYYVAVRAASRAFLVSALHGVTKTHHKQLSLSEDNRQCCCKIISDHARQLCAASFLANRNLDPSAVIATFSGNASTVACEWTACWNLTSNGMSTPTSTYDVAF